MGPSSRSTIDRTSASIGHRRRVQVAGSHLGQAGLQLPARRGGLLELGALGLDQRRQLVGRGARTAPRAGSAARGRRGRGAPRARRRGTPRGACCFTRSTRRMSDRADLAGGAHVGAAARAPVQVVDGDDPERALPRRRSCGARRRCPHPRTSPSPAGSPSRSRWRARSASTRLRVIDGRGVEIEGRDVLPEVHARPSRGRAARGARRRAGAGRCAAACGRTGAPSPPRHGTRAGQRTGDASRWATRSPSSTTSTTSTPPRVPRSKRLAARRGIEGGPVEVDAPSLVRAVDDVGLEVAQVGVGVVEAKGHGYRIGARRHARNRANALPFPAADRELQALL